MLVSCTESGKEACTAGTISLNDNGVRPLGSTLSWFDKMRDVISVSNTSIAPEKHIMAIIRPKGTDNQRCSCLNIFFIALTINEVDYFGVKENNEKVDHQYFVSIKRHIIQLQFGNRVCLRS